MTYHAGMGQYADPWTKTKATSLRRSLARRGMGDMDPVRHGASRGFAPPARAVAIPAISRAVRGLKYSMGQATTTPASAEPPPVGTLSVPMIVGWGAAVLVTAGILWAATHGVGTKAVRSNRGRGRRTSRGLKSFAYVRKGSGLSQKKNGGLKRHLKSHRSRRRPSLSQKKSRMTANLFGGSKRKLKPESSGGVWVEESPGTGAFVLFRHARPSAAAPWCIVDEAGKLLACETTEAKAREASRSLYGTSVERR